MGVSILFETHSISNDNEQGIASGWNPSFLSPQGRILAAELGTRRRNDKISAVLTSDLRRAVETAEIAFASSSVPIFHDWRLRECNYGIMNGAPAAQVHGERTAYLDTPYPGGESWREAVRRVGRVLADIPLFWNNSRILIIGHVATRWALEHFLNGIPLEELAVQEFNWRAGWEYILSVDSTEMSKFK